MAPDMDVSVEIHCESCGSANYSLPDGSADDAPIRCNDCGVLLGDVAALKAALIAGALGHSAEALRRGLDKLGQSEPS
jgi:DNA-directed RNA polymerase subunit N (RpoN/RPB10)